MERYFELAEKTPYSDAVHAKYQPNEEHIQEQNYKLELELRKLKRCLWITKIMDYVVNAVRLCARWWYLISLALGFCLRSLRWRIHEHMFAMMLATICIIADILFAWRLCTWQMEFWKKYSDQPVLSGLVDLLNLNISQGVTAFNSLAITPIDLRIVKRRNRSFPIGIQIFRFMDYTRPALSYVHVAHLTFSRFISCCSGLNTSMPLQLPLKPFLTIFMSSIRNLHHVWSILSIDSIEFSLFTLSFAWF